MPKKRHISLKDLAKELGVSVSTVSRALNDSYEIGPEMRERVKALPRNGITVRTRLPLVC